MKIAAFNVENLFDRAKAFNEESSKAQKAVRAVGELNALLEQDVYSDNDKTEILKLMKELGIERTDNGKYAILRKIRGKLIKRPKSKKATIVANGREDWVGWVELVQAHVAEQAIMNTGRVLSEVNADIVAVIEAEHRVALKQFSDYVITEVGGQPYEHVMLIDGNDTRGIDVGIMTRVGYNIGLMRSHIHDMNDDGNAIYSRDCPEYCVTTPDGEDIWILPNHFKSKFGGNDYSSRERRKAQAVRTAAIYNRLIQEGHKNVVVLGDLNDTPDSEELQPLLNDTTLKDVSEHPFFEVPAFDKSKHPGKGTYGLGNDSNKIDYLLLSPDLYDRITACGLFRKGAWPGSRPKRWEVFPELDKELYAASDHHLIWCEIE